MASVKRFRVPWLIVLVLAGVSLFVLRGPLASVRVWLLPDPARARTDPPAPAADRPGEVRSLDDILEAVRAEHKLPALAAALVEEGRLTGLGAVGVRRAGHAEPVRLEDPFHIGSCTKSMTATLCAILVDKGKLSWTTTLAEAFPDLAEEFHPEYRTATLEQLLAHRAGLPDDRRPDLLTWSKIRALTGPLPEQRRAFAKIILKSKPAAAPGSKHTYANAGYVLAGAMGEQATGQSWEDLLRRHLFEPLGMTTAGFGPPGKPEPVETPWGHRQGLLGWKPLPPGPGADNPAVTGPAGTVHCSMRDWARYALFHLQGARGSGTLLQPETFRKLHTDVHGDRYAGGWIVRERPGRGSVLAHDGSNTYWYATIWLAPQRNVARLVATNLGTDEASKACRQAMAKLAEAPPAP